MIFQTSDVSICKDPIGTPTVTIKFYVQALPCFRCCYEHWKFEILFVIPKYKFLPQAGENWMIQTEQNLEFFDKKTFNMLTILAYRWHHFERGFCIPSETIK